MAEVYKPVGKGIVSAANAVGSVFTGGGGGGAPAPTPAAKADTSASISEKTPPAIDAAQIAERQKRAAEALARRTAGGRASTIIAGDTPTLGGSVAKQLMAA